MNSITFFNFLRKNANLQGNEEAVKNTIQQFGSDMWWNGYKERIKQRRKQMILFKIRKDRFIKVFFDLLSDKTHGGKKK